jgi:iron complex outermembrane recepter protein
VRSIHNSLLCGASALVLCSVASSVAFADDQQEVVVVTGVRGSMRDSLIEKRNSPLVTDNVSTKDIGQLPDVTIAEELNRLPGVNTTRDRGNASQAAVRGLGPRLVFGLVNGREVASSEPSQDVRWEVYPSEVLSGAQVYKSQSAELIPGGIAATIDIRTISPLDYEGPALNLRAGPTYNEEGSNLPHYDPYGLRASGAYITHLNDNLAIAFAASYQKEKNGFPDFRTFGWNTPDGSGATPLGTPPGPDGNTGDLNGDGVPDNTNWGLVTEVKEVVQDRRAVMGAVGWRPTASLEVKFDALYSAYTITEDQFQTWYANNLGNWNNSNAAEYNCPGCSYTIKNNSVVAADLENIQQNGPGFFFAGPDYQSEIARYKEEHGLDVGGLNLHWQNGPWDAKFDLSHSDAWRTNRWSAIYLDTQWATGVKYNLTAGNTPTAQLLGPNPANPAIQSIGGVSHDIFGDSGGRPGEIDPERSTDTLSAATFDVTRSFDGSFLTAFDFGARLSDRAKRHDQWQSHPTAAPQSLAGDVSDFTLNAFNAPPSVYGDWDKLFPLVYPGASAAAQSAANELPLSHTRVTEQTQEGYVKADFSENVASIPMTGSLGVRIASVQTRSSGNETLGGVLTPVSLTNRYTDVLPDLNMVFSVSDTQQIHFGAGIAISRPPLDALTAGFTLPIGCTVGIPCSGAGGGNPFLKPYKADQLDLSYEWYFHDESLFAIAPYYKHLLTYITSASNIQTIGGQQYVVTDQGNGKGGDVEGIELTFQTRFYFLDGFLSDFGVYGNYSYAMSDIHEVAPSTVGFGQTPYSMVGLTKHTAEADLFYNKDGFEARIAYKYHSPTTVAPTWVGTTLKKEDAEGILDASVSYQWNEHIGVRLQGRNLTNEPNRFTSDNNIQNLSNDGGYQVFGRSFLFDISYKD